MLLESTASAVVLRCESLSYHSGDMVVRHEMAKAVVTLRSPLPTRIDPKLPRRETGNCWIPLEEVHSASRRNYLSISVEIVHVSEKFRVFHGF